MYEFIHYKDGKKSSTFIKLNSCSSSGALVIRLVLG